jgi:putative hydrolase of the HAD superfamily
MAVEAVIWDFGGVFTTSPFAAFNRFEAECGLPRDLLRRVNAANPETNAWAQFERARIDAETFDGLFLAESTALGWPVRGADILPLIHGAVRPRMVAALKACKRRFKVGCVTNNMADGAARPERPETAEIKALFDIVVESSKVGVRKPDPRIYLMMCERLGVAPEACVYLDDLGVNCKPAAQLGMRAIKVLDEDQALAELSGALGFDLTEEPA